MNYQPKDDVKKSTVQPIVILAPPTPTNPKENYVKPGRSIKAVNLVSILPKSITRPAQILTKIIGGAKAEKHISSYSSASHTESFLGLAILCLIAGIVLAYFGFLELAALFWVIAIICVAAAILFFILWIVFAPDPD